jgi:hypothetical protein
MITSAKTCQLEGGAALELDSKDTPTTVDPQSPDSERNISLAQVSRKVVVLTSGVE